ncbi:helix-turn-helix domain-containing protein [uncultured Acidaminococcus sp.]|uniref:helix-turn-helix domain-containing protein n=1 Tax=Acidaminococcus fermentans TaxID=905 RepID=UPI00258EC907|nr:helix-turn-helix transcriptional regulator [uncultured Acidaminococcus sp.]
MLVNKKRLLEAMVKKQMTQKELAKTAKISRTTVNQTLHRDKGVKLDVLGKLAAALDVPPLELIQK